MKVLLQPMNEEVSQRLIYENERWPHWHPYETDTTKKMIGLEPDDIVLWIGLNSSSGIMRLHLYGACFAGRWMDNYYRTFASTVLNRNRQLPLWLVEGLTVFRKTGNLEDIVDSDAFTPTHLKVIGDAVHVRPPCFTADGGVDKQTFRLPSYITGESAETLLEFLIRSNMDDMDYALVSEMLARVKEQLASRPSSITVSV